MGASTIITDYIGRGLAASRPTTPNVPSGCAAFYVATDTGVVSAWNGSTWATVGGSSGANPTATASDTAVNGTATTFMRSDGSPAIQKASAAQFGLVKVDGTTVTASAGVISAAAGSGVVDHPGFASGRYYSRPIHQAMATFTATANRLYAVPFYVPAATTFTKASLWVSSGVVSTAAELGVYANSGGLPGALEYDIGNLATTASATQMTLTSLSLALTAGMHWLAVGFNGAPGIRGSGVSDFISDWMGVDSSLSLPINGLWNSWTYAVGGLPNPFVTAGVAFLQATGAPMIFLGN